MINTKTQSMRGSFLLSPLRSPRSATALATTLALAVSLAACGAEQKPSSKTAASADDGEGGGLMGESKPGAEQLIPKEKKRQITEDQRAEFAKAMQRYESAKKSGGLSGSEC